ncbi:MAG: CHAT domain-containing protein [Acidobacteriota bacterium]
MHCISKEKTIAQRSLSRHLLVQCFIASLILGPATGTPRTALRSQANHQSPSTNSEAATRKAGARNLLFQCFIVYQCFIVSLILGSADGTPRTALRSQTNPQPPAINSEAAATKAGAQRGFAELETDKMSKFGATRKVSDWGRLRQVSYTPSVPQNPLAGLGLIAEGQALMARQTRQNFTDAIAKFKAGFALCQKNDNKGGMGAARLWEGIAYDSLGKPREALSAFLDAARYLEEGGVGFMNPMLLAMTGATYASLGETDKALDLLNRMLPLVKQANIPQFTAYVLKGLGDVNLQIGQKSKGIEYLTEALLIYQQTGDWLHEVQVLPLISALRSSLGQPTEALKIAHEAVERSREKGAPDWEAYSYFAVGAAYASMGNLEEAAAAYNRSLQLLQGQDDLSGEATALNNLGLIYVTRGRFDLALDYFERAKKLAESSGELKLAAYAANNIGVIYARRGHPLTAFRSFKEALDFAVSRKDKRLEATVLSSLADTYFIINSPNYSLSLLKEAAAAFSAIEDRGHEAEALINVAYGYTALGRFQEALDVLRPLLVSPGIAEDPARQGYVLRGLGYIYSYMGEREKALKHFEEALAKLELAGDDNGKDDLYAAWGMASVANGDYQKAEELYTKGLDLAETAGIRQSQPFFLTGLGYLREKQGNLARAEGLYDQGIAVSESMRSSAHLEELKTVVGMLAVEVFSPAILLKFKLGKWAEAFELAERARARTFLDQMNTAHLDLRKGADPALAGQEQSLRFDMRALEEKLRKERRENPRSEAGALMAASLKEKEETYNTVLIRLKASNPDYAELQSYFPRPLNEIQRLLGPQTTLISYYVAADKTLAFVVGSDSLQAIEIPVKEVDLRAAINWFRDFASLRDPQPEGLKQLHGWLIAPIRQYIKTAQVIIVPHGLLHYVPFAALTDGHGYFGDERAITYLPSASILPALRRRIQRAGQRVLIIAQSLAPGLSALRYADEEARSVARLYGAHPLLTGRATRAEFLKRASRYNMLHIAAHAELNATSPLFSRILLSPGNDDSGAIEVREIYGMDLTRTNLVALSACETQLGAQSKGDDIVGLNRAFIYAGASSVIASLWTVDDEGTSLLMKVFYGHLKRGMSKAAALQAAQAATRKKYPHPYYWAAFVLTGDPGKDSGRGLTNARAFAHGPRRFR